MRFAEWLGDLHNNKCYTAERADVCVRARFASVKFVHEVNEEDGHKHFTEKIMQISCYS